MGDKYTKTVDELLRFTAGAEDLETASKEDVQERLEALGMSREDLSESVAIARGLALVPKTSAVGKDNMPPEIVRMAELALQTARAEDCKMYVCRNSAGGLFNTDDHAEKPTCEVEVYPGGRIVWWGDTR